MGKHRKLGRQSDHRVAMLRNMTTSIIAHGRIETTETRAKELRKLADKMITLGKRGDLHARRQALSFIYDKNVVAKLFEEIAPKYEGRNGGYTRILKLGPRRGDGAEMVIIELV
ncbi:MAG: 50S ribosomal protein L17 [Firmicutes bacterium HGW-Firmicutes-18]|jgi:large subunit ribosomal protein L17|nr:50S ribosomal protein L17 [Dethiosulfatibacter sp.]PKM70681.1 MAG: 50S ribosomal protein L17 [Firmicutes bacterium HGW-Firmicutes-18]HAE42215.1 50S ribosomal protein L17 [Clostridiales bacterium]